MTIFKITNATSVFTSSQAAFDPVLAPGPNTLTVDPSAFLITTGVFKVGAILGGSGIWTVTVNGSVLSSTGEGMNLAPGIAGTSSIKIGADGEIGSFDFGIDLGSSAIVTNAGVISSQTTGVAIQAAGVTIANSGVIHGGAYSIRDVGGLSADKVTNSGLLDGDVDLAGGDDTLSNSKSILSLVDLGEGNNKLTNSGTIAGDFSAGSGNDTVSNTGILQFVDLGDGNNKLTNSGTIDDVAGGIGKDTVSNTGKISDFVFLDDGEDTYTGGNFVDRLHDGGGNDVVNLGGGNDYYLATLLVGGGGLDGIDTVNGGAGSDTYDASNSDDQVLINLDTVAHEITPGVGTLAGKSALGQDTGGDVITGFENAFGSGTNDIIYGNAAANMLAGNGGGDNLLGFGGNDDLRGGTGLDAIAGGAGKDTLTGGDHADVFQYFSAKDSGPTTSTRDVITDFEDGVDLIDLSFFDAYPADGPGHTAFTFIGTNVPFNVAGAELRARWTVSGQIVEGDINGDAKADFAIELLDPTHAIAVDLGDLIL